MTPRKLLISALEGDAPDRTPLSIYDWNMGAITTGQVVETIRQDRWRRLIERGLTIRHHCPAVRAIEHGVEYAVNESHDTGRSCRTETKATPVGMIRTVTCDGWRQEHWIKTPADYRVQQWIVEHTELRTDYEAVGRAMEAVADCGVMVLTGAANWQHRTPAMCIQVDWAGPERFCSDVALEVPELFDLFDAHRKLFLEEQRLIAGAPGRYVVWFENLTANLLGPRRYESLLSTVYRDAVPLLEAGGKRVMAHYDGALRAVAEQVAAVPIPIIDSLTEWPEGDMAYDECRAIWPDKVFWANINVDLYCRPIDELRRALIEKRQRAGKRGFAFEVSEALPDNWEESLPIVLDVLEYVDNRGESEC